jgi:hypothetical protein
MTNESNTPMLAVLKGPAKGKVFHLATNLITIGRGDEADIRLAGDNGISRLHVNLRLKNNRYVLANQSNNGTVVNGKLADEKELVNGDRIRIGEEYLLEFSDGSKPFTSIKPSLFKKPAVLALCGVYAAALVAAAVYLSNAPEPEGGLDSARVATVIQEYGQYMSAASFGKDERDARAAAVRAYLRSAFIAEREGNYPEARRVYLKVLDYAKDGRSPVYQYALERLRSVPAERK